MVSVLINGNIPFTWQKKKNTWDALHFNIVCGRISLQNWCFYYSKIKN